MTKILINAGPSPRGWHRLEPFLTCPTRYYWRSVAKLASPPADPLVRGSIFHVLLAHFYAIRTAIAWGHDPSQFYTPHEAAAILAIDFGETGARMLPVALRAFARYQQVYAVEAFEVVGIEKLLEIDFEGFRYTARADLIVKVPSTGKVWIYDHKLTARIDDRTFQRYGLSGQFLGLHHLGRAEFGASFGGVVVNAVGVSDNRCERRAPPPAPWALMRFPKNIAMAERKIRDLEEMADVTLWPMATSETTCIGPYGRCDFYDVCRWGPKE